ncbi:MAG: hypothetical protein J3R72DRAFT_170719 [Linnemannia gamsii]|nr:MAG: hypothetical protein J3R72DRAFT_170719 [Linnemannia gamsii]
MGYLMGTIILLLLLPLLLVPLVPLLLLLLLLLLLSSLSSCLFSFTHSHPLSCFHPPVFTSSLSPLSFHSFRFITPPASIIIRIHTYIYTHSHLNTHTHSPLFPCPLLSITSTLPAY